MRWHRPKTKSFPKELMRNLAETYSGEVKYMGEWNERIGTFAEDELYEVIVNEHYDDSRWNSVHNLVFLEKSSGKYYHTRYERGLTESQMCNPFDGEVTVECDEVTISTHIEQITVTTWKEVLLDE